MLTGIFLNQASMCFIEWTLFVKVSNGKFPSSQVPVSSLSHNPVVEGVGRDMWDFEHFFRPLFVRTPAGPSTPRSFLLAHSFLLLSFALPQSPTVSVHLPFSTCVYQCVSVRFGVTLFEMNEVPGRRVMVIRKVPFPPSFPYPPSSFLFYNCLKSFL